MESGPGFDSKSKEMQHRITKIYKWVNLLGPLKALNLVDFVKIETVLSSGRYEQRLRWFAAIKFGEEYTGKNSTGISAESMSLFQNAATFVANKSSSCQNRKGQNV